MGKDLKGKELGNGISQRKNGSYCGRYVDRFGVRKSIYDKDLRVLKKKLLDAEYENKNEISVVDDKITLDQWYEKWMLVYKNDIIRPNTKRHYHHIYTRHISPELGRLPLNSITQLQIKGLINKLKKDGFQWETQNKVRVLLIDMFNRAFEDNFVRRNPAKGVRLASEKPNERKVLTQDEQIAFFKCCSGTFYDNLFIVAVNTGLRPGELFALTWDDIDLEKKMISVTKTLVYQKFEEDEHKEFHIGLPKTQQSIRQVPINSICENALKRQFVQKAIIKKKSNDIKKESKREDLANLLFTTKYDTPLNSVLYSEAIAKIVNEVNLTRDTLDEIEKFSGHTFRHTFATRCIEAGVRPKTLQAYLGHATLQMTMDLYVHTTDESKQLEMELFENEIGKLTETDSMIERRFQGMIKNEKKIIRMA